MTMENIGLFKIQREQLLPQKLLSLRNKEQSLQLALSMWFHCKIMLKICIFVIEITLNWNQAYIGILTARAKYFATGSGGNHGLMVIHKIGGNLDHAIRSWIHDYNYSYVNIAR